MNPLPKFGFLQDSYPLKLAVSFLPSQNAGNLKKQNTINNNSNLTHSEKPTRTLVFRTHWHSFKKQINQEIKTCCPYIKTICTLRDFVFQLVSSNDKPSMKFFLKKPLLTKSTNLGAGSEWNMLVHRRMFLFEKWMFPNEIDSFDQNIIFKWS